MENTKNTERKLDVCSEGKEREEGRKNFDMKFTK